MKRITILDNKPFLRQVSTEVDFNDKSYIEDIKKLKQYCEEHNKVYAMAAVQIGIPKRLIYIKSIDLSTVPSESIDNNIIIINPIIKSVKGLTRFHEACESCCGKRGNLTGLIDRPYEVNIEYYDINKNLIKKTIYGMEATVFCHEYDHLEGILHIDLNPNYKDLTFEERKVLREKEPFIIISKNNEYKTYTKKIEN